MNKTLEQRLKSIPQVLQDLVSEYNVEHRVQMKKVFEEYFSVIFTKCINCNSVFDLEIYCSVDYFINQRFNMRHHFCSEECFNENDHELDIKKNEYVTSVNDYLTNITIQLPRQTADFTTF